MSRPETHKDTITHQVRTKNGIREWSDKKVRKLCTAIRDSETSKEVRKVLESHGLDPDDPSLWRAFGDTEGNYAIFENQKSDPEEALVEPITNGMDAYMTFKLLEKGIPLSGPECPQNMPEAIARTGYSTDLETYKIILFASGLFPKEGGLPNVHVLDKGVGINPDDIPYTIVAVLGHHKNRYPWANGEYHQGGTATYAHLSGEDEFSFIMSRPCAQICSGDRQWGFTVVRYFPPSEGEGFGHHRFLAPLVTDDPKGGVLRFSGDMYNVPIRKEGTYVGLHEHGTMIKYFEYALSLKGVVTRNHALIDKFTVLFPHSLMSFGIIDTRMGAQAMRPQPFITGVAQFGGRNWGKLVDGFPLQLSVPLTVKRKRKASKIYNLPVTVCAQNPEVRASRRRDARYGIVYSVNGITHAKTQESTFLRSNLEQIKEYVWVIVDMTEVQKKEGVFRSSRDQFTKSDVRDSCVKAVSRVLSSHPQIKQFVEHEYRKHLDSASSNAVIYEGIIKDPVVKKFIDQRIILEVTPEVYPPTRFVCTENPKVVVGTREGIIRFECNGPSDLFKGKGWSWKLFNARLDLITNVRCTFSKRVFRLYIPKDKIGTHPGDDENFSLFVFDENGTRTFGIDFTAILGAVQTPGKVSGSGNEEEDDPLKFQKYLNPPTVHRIGKDQWSDHDMKSTTPCRYYYSKHAVWVNTDCIYIGTWAKYLGCSRTAAMYLFESIMAIGSPILHQDLITRFKDDMDWVDNDTFDVTTSMIAKFFPAILRISSKKSEVVTQLKVLSEMEVGQPIELESIEDSILNMFSGGKAQGLLGLSTAAPAE